MHTISSYRGNRPKNTQSHTQDRLQYTAPQLARTVIMYRNQSGPNEQHKIKKHRISQRTDMAGFSRHLRYARFGNCIPQVTIFNIYYTLLKGTCLSCYYHKKNKHAKHIGTVQQPLLGSNGRFSQ